MGNIYSIAVIQNLVGMGNGDMVDNGDSSSCSQKLRYYKELRSPGWLAANMGRAQKQNVWVRLIASYSKPLLLKGLPQ